MQINLLNKSFYRLVHWARHDADTGQLWVASWPISRRHQAMNQTTADQIDTLSPRQDGRYFPAAIFKCIFLDENILNFE